VKQKDLAALRLRLRSLELEDCTKLSALIKNLLVDLTVLLHSYENLVECPKCGFDIRAVTEEPKKIRPQRKKVGK
jgi:hypothetical protein